MTAIARLRHRYAETAGPLRSERRLELVVLAFTVLILLQLLWLGTTALREPAITAIAPAVDSLRAAATAPALFPSEEQSMAVRARPLFWASRRPGAGEELLDPVVDGADGSQLGTPAKALKALQLTGVYGIGSEGGVIVIYKGKRRRIATGQELDGWQLESVGPGDAVFVSAGARDVRELLQRTVGSAGGSASDPSDAGVRVPAPDAGVNNDIQKKEVTNKLTLGG